MDYEKTNNIAVVDMNDWFSRHDFFNLLKVGGSRRSGSTFLKMSGSAVNDVDFFRRLMKLVNNVR